jgi:hypothetical protein
LVVVLNVLYEPFKDKIKGLVPIPVHYPATPLLRRRRVVPQPQLPLNSSRTARLFSIAAPFAHFPAAAAPASRPSLPSRRLQHVLLTTPDAAYTTSFLRPATE